MIYLITSEGARRRCANDIMRLTGKGPVMSVEVKKYVKNRSTAQNRLYWKWITIIGDHLGMEKEEMHDTFRLHFLGVIDREFEKIKLRELKTTTTLTTDEFTKYLEKILRYAGQENIKLPMDDEFNYAMGYDKQQKETPSDG